MQLRISSKRSPDLHAEEIDITKMFFSQSSQRSHWCFASTDELESHRQTARRHYIWENLEANEMQSKISASARQELQHAISNLTESTRADNTEQSDLEQIIDKFFLNRDEETVIQQYYAEQLVKKAAQYRPPLPRPTVATAVAFYKRFYLHHSAMQFHPKEILITSLFLACKVDEHYISLQDFCAVYKGDRDRAREIILNMEPLFMDRISYDFVVHLPYRPVEGFLIDMKTRSGLWPPGRAFDAENLRPYIDKFLNDSVFSDAILLYSPSQIALAAVCEAAEILNLRINSYIESKLCAETANSADDVVEIKAEDGNPVNPVVKINFHKAARLLATIDTIRTLVKQSLPEKQERDVIKLIESKIEACRDPRYSFGTEEYQKRVAQLMGLDVAERIDG